MPIVNIQPKESRTGVEDDGGYLDVVHIWDTIQGEGPYAGTPAVFIRLAGCNLDCKLCDTDYTTGRKTISIFDIATTVGELVIDRSVGVKRRPGLVVLTGGEPFRQNIQPLVEQLIRAGYTVQIETNGTIFRQLPFNYATAKGRNRLCIVCSPKAAIVNTLLQTYVGALKYLVSADNVSPDDGLPLAVLGSPHPIARPWSTYTGDIYIQPEDHQDPIQNKRNIDAAVESCRKFGYRLCLQVHKIIGVE